MNLRRTVAIALSLTLASTVLVSGVFLSRSSADEGDQPPAQFLQDRPNEPTVQGEVAAPPRSVEAVPTPDAPSRETPKGDGKKRDWFLKNDAKSQADAIADEIELRNQPGSQGDAKLTVPPVRPGPP